MSSTDIAAPKHPAKFSKQLLPTISEWLARIPDDGDRRVLDPMAGTGEALLTVCPDAYLNELEPEWAEVCVKGAKQGRVTCYDARELSLFYPTGCFHAIVTSPTYGNRMADHHEAKDASTRNTYRHKLGRSLSWGNTGQLQWGDEYREVHRDIWTEVSHILAPGGTLILNVKDHIRKCEVQPVSAWHLECLEELGFVLTEWETVPCPGNRFGANAEKRVDHENLFLLRKPLATPGVGMV